MSTRSFVGIGNVDYWTGRYVHYDGYPSGVGAAVWEGLQDTGPAFIAEAMRHDWSSFPNMWGAGADGVCYCCNYTDHSRECVLQRSRDTSLPLTIKSPTCGDDCIEIKQQIDAPLQSSEYSAASYCWEKWGYVVSEDKQLHVLHWGDAQFVVLGSFPIDGPTPNWQSLEDAGNALQ